MRLQPTPQQDELRKTVRSFLKHESPLPAIRAVVDTDSGYDLGVWSRLGNDIGVIGFAIPAERGGQGYGIVELAAVMEECGAALLPGPLLGSTVICGLILDAVGDRSLLRDVASGTVVAALVQGPTVSVQDGAAHGYAQAVLDGMNARVLIVVTDDGVFAVDPAIGVDRSPLVTVDVTRRLAEIRLHRAPASRLGDARRVGYALDRAAVALAAEQLGVIRSAVEMAVAYSAQRVQFGRAIGSFQAVKHGLADMYASYELAIGAVAYAAWAADNAIDELPVAASLARAYLSPQAFDVTFQMIQYHGGIGYTWEHDAHLYYKRAYTSQTLLGDTETHLERLAAHLLDEAST